MNIIFLDFDGVITSRETDYKFSQILLKRLGRIISETNAHIVITSSWRGIDKESTIQNITDPTNPSVGSNPFPFTDRIIGVTPRCGAWQRGQEIDTWFERWKNIPEIKECNYIILDDEMDFTEKQKHHLISTSNLTGLTDKDVEKAIKFLNE